MHGELQHRQFNHPRSMQMYPIFEVFHDHLLLEFERLGIGQQLADGIREIPCPREIKLHVPCNLFRSMNGSSFWLR
jgi:hypothetical protein